MTIQTTNWHDKAKSVTLPSRPFIAALDGFPPEGLTADLTFRVERLFPFFAALHDAGIRKIAFAGAVRRPRLARRRLSFP